MNKDARKAKNDTIYRLFVCLIAIVWLINGLICKTLNLVSRHQEIVARILSPGHAELLTTLIGVGETFMAIWVLSRLLPRICTIVQVILIITMNSIEYFMVPDLLLFGKFNAVLAL